MLTQTLLERWQDAVHFLLTFDCAQTWCPPFVDFVGFEQLLQIFDPFLFLQIFLLHLRMYLIIVDGWNLIILIYFQSWYGFRFHGALFCSLRRWWCFWLLRVLLFGLWLHAWQIVILRNTLWLINFRTMLHLLLKLNILRRWLHRHFLDYACFGRW